MYVRKNNTHPVEWNPDDEDLGLEAVESVTGGVDVPVEVDSTTSSEIRAEYRELHVEKYGEDSPYYEEE